MSHGIDQCFENRRQVVLRNIPAAQVLYAGYFHVSCHKTACFAHLFVQRSGNITGIQLVGHPAAIVGSRCSSISNCLYERIGHPITRFTARYQDTGHGRMKNSFSVSGGKSELFEKIHTFIPSARCAKPIAKGRIKRIHGGWHHRLLIKTDHSRLAALLTQPNYIIRGHFALTTADSIKMSVRTFVHIQASRNIHFQYRRGNIRCVRQLPFFNPAQRRRFDSVIANARKPMLQYS